MISVFVSRRLHRSMALSTSAAYDASTRNTREQARRRLTLTCFLSSSFFSSASSLTSNRAHASVPAAMSSSPPPAPPASSSLRVAFVPRHAALPDVLPTSRVLFVGDVHGCYEELQELIALSGVQVGVDTIVLTGDLIAKGPAPFDVLRFVQSTAHVHSVMGNHERHAVTAILRNQDQPLQSVVPPYDQRPHEHVAAALSPADRQWLASLPLSISLPSLQPPHVVVHAGLVPGVALSEQKPIDVMNMRNLTADGAGTKSKKEGVNWVERWYGPEVVIFGHAAARGLQRPEGGWALGLDTGCCYGKQLTGWLLPERRLLQVRAKRVYQQPDEK